jgi:hypothetical protein
VTKELRTPDPQDYKPGEREPDARRVLLVEPWISEQVFALYDGLKMTKQDERDARLLAAQWQIIYTLKVNKEQMVTCTRGLVQMLDAILGAVKPGCPGCGGK